MTFHQIKVKADAHKPHMTSIELDGEPFLGVVSIKFAASVRGIPTVSLELFADVEIEGEAAIVKRWRRARKPQKGEVPLT